MTTRLELVLRGDPMLKNELIQNGNGALFSKRSPLRAAQMFIRGLLSERDAWQSQAYVQARNARARGIPPLVTPCRVTWTHLRVNRHRIDTAAIAYPTWGILDGLVKGGMLADDDFTRVVAQTYRVEVVGFEGIRVLVETVPDSPVQDALGGLE